MDSYLFDGVDLSREQAEQLVREYAAVHDGYFSLMDEAKQTGRNKTRKQLAEAARDAQEGGKAPVVEGIEKETSSSALSSTRNESGPDKYPSVSNISIKNLLTRVKGGDAKYITKRKNERQHAKVCPHGRQDRP